MSGSGSALIGRNGPSLQGALRILQLNETNNVNITCKTDYD